MKREFKNPYALEWREDVKGTWEIILSRDEKTGTYSRLLRTEPGWRSGKVLIHDFDEIVYILKGGIINEETGEVYQTGTYAFFPAGTKHGPFLTPIGVVTLEFRHYK
ncbi:MAG: cupin domain-containing protein [Candidatus Geothermarchaeales archaeon]